MTVEEAWHRRIVDIVHAESKDVRGCPHVAEVPESFDASDGGER